MPRLGIAMAILASNVLMTIAYFWVAIIAFQDSWVKAVGVLLCVFYWVFFAIFEFRECEYPLYVFGLALAFVGYAYFGEYYLVDE